MYQLSKKQTEVFEERIKSLESKAYPAEAEIARLTKENNMLHEQVIQEKQAANSAENNLIIAAKRESDLKKDLNYLISAKDNRVQTLVDDNMALKSKLEEIIKRGLDQYSNDKSGKLAVELRKKIAETHHIVSSIRNDCKGMYEMASALKRAEQEIVTAKTFLIEAQSHNLNFKSQLDSKDQAILLKEKEIRRLQAKTVENGIVHLQDFWNKNYSE